MGRRLLGVVQEHDLACAAVGGVVKDGNIDRGAVWRMRAEDFKGQELELGPDERALHERIGAEAATVLDGLVTVGERGRWIAEAARAAGLAVVATAANADDAREVVDRALAPRAGDVLLVKASRGVALDELVAALTGRPAAET